MEELEVIQMVLGVLLFGAFGLTAVLGISLYKESKKGKKENIGE